MLHSISRVSQICVRLAKSTACEAYTARRAISTSPASLGNAFFYRGINPNPPKGRILGGDLLVGFMWYWILFHLYYDSGHLFGEHDYPEPSQWTDAELGIPADD